MTENTDTLVPLDDDGASGLLELKHRSVDEARDEVKRRLWFLPVALLIIAVMGFGMGDWIYVALMGAVIGFGVVRLLGELKEPRRYLQVPPHKLVDRILAHRRSLQAPGPAMGDAERQVQIQELIDALAPGKSWLGPNRFGVGKWSGILGAVLWVAFTVIMFVAGEGVLGAIVPLVAASLFGAGAVWSARAESKREEALDLLEKAR